MAEQKKQRDVGPELLRIMAMIMIILSHISVHGGLVYQHVCANSLLLSVLSLGGKTGVNIFILICGYYSINIKPTVKKAMMLITQTVFYCVTLYGFSCFVDANPFRLKYLLYAFFPFVSNRGSWFITIYILLYALIPFINNGLKKLTQRQHIFLICLFVLVWSILPHTYGRFFGMQDYAPSILAWFVVLYSIGAYLNMYPIKLFQHRFLSVLLLFCTVFLMSASQIMLILTEQKKEKNLVLLKTILSFLSDGSSYGPLAILFSILSLVVFLQIKLKPNRIIYAIAGSTFGIYLIHDSEWIREYLWNDLIQLKRFTNSSWFALDLLIVMVLVFVMCSAVDILRKKILEEPFFRSKPYAAAESFCIKCFDTLSQKLHIQH